MNGVLHLGDLLDRRIVDRDGGGVGRVTDVVVRLGTEGYPLATGLVARVGGRELFLSREQVGDLDASPLRLEQPRVDLRRFERREGEVLLRADVLRHRLLHVPDARLVRAWDVELVRRGRDWVVGYLDTRRPRRLFGLVPPGHGHPREDWKSFAPLVGHVPSARLRGLMARLGGLKPAQIADLLEDASKSEQTEILDAVHADPELEADVFEELEPDRQNQLFADRSDEQVAEVLTHMRADDAADAVAELPQQRRQSVLDLLPLGQRTKVLTLMTFHPHSAGGLMELDYLAAPGTATVAQALKLVRAAADWPAQALVNVYVTDEEGRLTGVATLPALLQAPRAATLAEVAEPHPVHVHPSADVVDVALRMSDYNLVTIPVADDAHRLAGIVTVDDVLEVTIPDDWRRREPAHEAHQIETTSSQTAVG